MIALFIHFMSHGPGSYSCFCTQTSRVMNSKFCCMIESVWPAEILCNGFKEFKKGPQDENLQSPPKTISLP